ncbi:hypothetical protein LTR70_008783 [Exophiala xenobiotica]|uniref:NAD(P)-binding protein n=1 Tax=Lithohypha guttulata TaxID=1690604 RepID=A0ABR0JUF2_9EURO|nr:hypothetical protein LTR24_010395 [Lithohypha guttulata]KAK5311453.1 hypothetical protein LTR70_008783 [Exophiala xenobiotica]
MSIDVNLTHPIRCTQLAIAQFLSSSEPASQGEPKTVVHISSIAGEGAFTPVPLYVATKWGLRGFIYSLAEIEATRHLRVAAVAPGVVRTQLFLEHEDKRKLIVDDSGKEQTDCTTPEEVAQVMHKICTQDQISNAKGELIPLRGGSLIEVINQDLRDVPMYGSQPPGTDTDMKGLAMVNVTEAWKDMNAAVEKRKWGIWTWLSPPFDQPQAMKVGYRGFDHHQCGEGAENYAGGYLEKRIQREIASIHSVMLQWIRAIAGSN